MVNIQFKCPGDVYDRLLIEKSVRNTTAQEICLSALCAYLNSKDPMYAIDEMVRIMGTFKSDLDARNLKKLQALREKYTNAETLTIELQSESERSWIQLWITFIREMPDETVKAVERIVHDLVDLFQSARRRPAGKGQGKTDGEA